MDDNVVFSYYSAVIEILLLSSIFVLFRFWDIVCGHLWFFGVVGGGSNVEVWSATYHFISYIAELLTCVMTLSWGATKLADSLWFERRIALVWTTQICSLSEQLKNSWLSLVCALFWQLSWSWAVVWVSYIQQYGLSQLLRVVNKCLILGLNLTMKDPTSHMCIANLFKICWLTLKASKQSECTPESTWQWKKTFWESQLLLSITLDGS